MTSEQSNPVIQLVLPEEKADFRSAAYYLHIERRVAETLPFPTPDTCYFFAWRLRPTCVCGRNQVIEQELDLDFCRREGIEIVRRHSGGGTIFADEGNIMFSLVSGSGAVETAFAAYTAAMVRVLRSLGIPAVASGRNDICLEDGGKISGGAFYHLPTRNIAHGTMLFDTNMRRMQGALTPPAEKLARHGVESVRSRVALLKDCLPAGYTPARLKAEILQRITDRKVVWHD